MRPALLLLVGCSPGTSLDDTAAAVGPQGLATFVLDAPGASTRPFRDPTLAVNGVRGAGEQSGSTDVYSLGLEGSEASLTLGWDIPLQDAPGPDVAVYENPFRHAGGVFIDPVVVQVSADGIEWVTFPHDYIADDEEAWSADPEHWIGFAGLTPVRHHEENNPTDPLNRNASGGDLFDLADLEGLEGADRPLEKGVCCIRLWSATAVVNPDTGVPFPRDPVSNGADIDGVYAR